MVSTLRRVATGLVLVALATTSCDSGRPGGASGSDPGPIATHGANEVVTAADLDDWIRGLPESQRSPAGEQEFVPWLRGHVQGLLFHRLLWQRARESGLVDEPEHRRRVAEAHRQRVFGAWLVRHAETPDEDESEIEAAVEEWLSRQEPERAQVHHLFLAAEGRSDAQLRSELEDLRRAAETGMDFRVLASQHSESESRFRSGLLGWAPRGSFAPDLEDLIFSLPTQRVSEPFMTSDGGHLFWVAERTGGERDPEDVEFEVRRVLEQRARRAQIAELVESLDPLPEPHFVPSPEDLAGLLTSADRRTVVLEVGDYRVRLGDLSESGTPEPPDGLMRRVEDLVARERVYRHFADRPEGRLVPDDVLRAMERRLAVEAELRTGLLDLVRRTRDVRGFWERHRRRWASPLRLRVERAFVPLSTVRGEQARSRLEGWLEGVKKGHAAPDAARQAAVELRDLGWRTLEEIGALGPNAARIAAEMEAGTLSVPFRGHGTLEVLRVRERREPRSLEFAEAEPEVVRELVDLEREDLMGELREEILADAGAMISEPALVAFADRLSGPTVPGADPHPSFR